MEIEGNSKASIKFHRQKVDCLTSLDSKEGPFDGIIAAAGAGNGLIQEIGKSGARTVSLLAQMQPQTFNNVLPLLAFL